MIRRPVTAAAVLVLLAGAASATAATADAATPHVLVVSPPGARCPGATFTDVATAVAAARPGDTVRLCPGTYASAVVVDRTITLEGPLPTPTVESCLAADASDPGRQAVLTGGLTLAAPRVVARGLVTEGVGTAITTDPRYGGYRITGNLVRGAGRLGVELETSGVGTTEVDHNCVRDQTGGGIVAEYGPLRNAVIHDNVSHGNNEAVSALGAYPHDLITVTAHRSIGDSAGIVLAGTVLGRITDNHLDGTGSGSHSGIQIGGGNNGLVVSGNDVSHFATGILHSRYGSTYADPRPSRWLLVAGNAVHDNVGSGSSMGVVPLGAPPYVQNSLISGNTFDRNGNNGFVLAGSSTQNIVAYNTARDNGRSGILAAPGSTDNSFVGNTMTGNGAVFGGVDALDANTPTNTWVGNHCVTSSPEGLCTP